MRTWRTGLTASVVFHAALAVWALRTPAPEPPARTPTPIQLTFVEIESAPEAAPIRETTPTRTEAADVVEKPIRPRRPSAAESPEKSTASAGGTGEGKGSGGADGAVTVPGAGEGGAGDSVARIELGVPTPRAPTVEDAVLLPPPPPPPAADPRFKEKGGGDYAYEHKSFTAKIKHDGTVEFDDHLAGYTGLGMWFDVTDSLMAAAGDDAYKAHKLDLLDATRTQRLEMAAEACEERLDNTLYNLRADLDAIWADQKLTTDQKKRTIFQLWDDCAESGPSNVVEHGKLARTTIVAFVANKLPKGSAFGFTTEELVSLNRRRQSAAPFAPYGSSP